MPKSISISIQPAPPAPPPGTTPSVCHPSVAINFSLHRLQGVRPITRATISVIMSHPSNTLQPRANTADSRYPQRRIRPGADPALVQQGCLCYYFFKLRSQLRRRQRRPDLHLRFRHRVSAAHTTCEQYELTCKNKNLHLDRQSLPRHLGRAEKYTGRWVSAPILQLASRR